MFILGGAPCRTGVLSFPLVFLFALLHISASFCCLIEHLFFISLCTFFCRFIFICAFQLNVANAPGSMLHNKCAQGTQCCGSVKWNKKIPFVEISFVASGWCRCDNFFFFDNLVTIRLIRSEWTFLNGLQAGWSNVIWTHKENSLFFCAAPEERFEGRPVGRIAHVQSQVIEEGPFGFYFSPHWLLGFLTFFDIEKFPKIAPKNGWVRPPMQTPYNLHDLGQAWRPGKTKAHSKALF